MKLASLKSGGRDGTLVVLDQFGDRAVPVPQIAPTMQSALDNWADVEVELRSVYRLLNQGKLNDAFALDVKQLHAPLPRAYQWADGSAYLPHVELVRKSRGAEVPASFYTDPLMYQGGSDTFLGPADAIELADEAYGCDFEAEVAVITDDVPMGVTPDEARDHIKLVMLVNDVSLRNLIPAELEKGFGFFHGKPSSAFSPCAVTPDELGDAWDGGKVQLRLRSMINGQLFGDPDTGTDMTFDFGQLIAHAAKTRHLGAGTIIGSGTISNQDRSHGHACIMEKRMLEKLQTGAATTPFLKFGDRVKIEMLDNNGQSIFGPIDQQVIKYERLKRAA
ncbi:MAG: FAA hydrolase family protein [Alphaproteobacteria bacterium]|nr:MAG: FAA hydrolase family protein [Alphaproteobacteria bacterium]